ncbi:YadA-like family protein, partial [Vibrio sp. E150_011]
PSVAPYAPTQMKPADLVQVNPVPSPVFNGIPEKAPTPNLVPHAEPNAQPMKTPSVAPYAPTQMKPADLVQVNPVPSPVFNGIPEKAPTPNLVPHAGPSAQPMKTPSVAPYAPTQMKPADLVQVNPRPSPVIKGVSPVAAPTFTRTEQAPVAIPEKAAVPHPVPHAVPYAHPMKAPLVAPQTPTQMEPAKLVQVNPTPSPVINGVSPVAAPTFTRTEQAPVAIPEKAAVPHLVPHAVPQAQPMKAPLVAPHTPTQMKPAQLVQVNPTPASVTNGVSPIATPTLTGIAQAPVAQPEIVPTKKDIARTPTATVTGTQSTIIGYGKVPNHESYNGNEEVSYHVVTTDNNGKEYDSVITGTYSHYLADAKSARGDQNKNVFLTPQDANDDAKATAPAPALAATQTSIATSQSGGTSSVPTHYDTAIEANRVSSQNNEAAITKNSSDIAQNKNDIRDLRNALEDQAKVMDGAMAQGIATSSLVMPYNVGKITTTVALGHSGSADAIAGGVGIRFTKNFTARSNIAYDTGSENVSIGAGVGYEW